MSIGLAIVRLGTIRPNPVHIPLTAWRWGSRALVDEVSG